MNEANCMIYTGAVALIAGVAWFDLRLGLLAAGVLLMLGGVIIARQVKP